MKRGSLVIDNCTYLNYSLLLWSSMSVLALLAVLGGSSMHHNGTNTVQSTTIISNV
jgi:hypothetical protein